jgi:hypothetical protein
VALLIVHNCGYIWTRKHAQYVERAAPTEILLKVARQAQGPIYLHCFPYDKSIAQATLEVAGVKISEPPVIGSTPPVNATPLCFGLHKSQKAAAE